MLLFFLTMERMDGMNFWKFGGKKLRHDFFEAIQRFKMSVLRCFENVVVLDGMIVLPSTTYLWYVNSCFFNEFKCPNTSDYPT